MKLFSFASVLVVALVFSSCDKDRNCDDDDRLSKEYLTDFDNGTEPWQPLFSDYPVGEESFYQLAFVRESLPAPLDQTKMGLKLSGNNHSDDLLTIIYRMIDGLEPNRNYGITISAGFASNTCKGCPGIGGSPDLSLGGGALSFAPANIKVQTGGKEYYRPNFSSDLQGHRSNDTLKVLGKIGTGDGSNPPYSILTLDNENNELVVKSNDKGQLWIMVGTDSGFEGITTLYYTKIKVKLVKK